MSSLLSNQAHSAKPAHRRRIIIITALIALILSIMPLPAGMQIARPDWPLLLLVYWVIYLPHRVGVGSAWLLGLLEDVAKGALLGQYALGYALVAFSVMMFYRRIRVFPLPQQALLVGALSILPLSLALWIYGLTGIPTDGLEFWWPVITTALAWFIVQPILSALHRHYKIT